MRHLDVRAVLRKAKNYTKIMSEEEKLRQFSYISNRRYEQTLFLYQLLECDFDMLMELQSKIKKHFIFYCPSNKREIAKILSL